jgi:hypothetical protein
MCRASSRSLLKIAFSHGLGGILPFRFGSLSGISSTNSGRSSWNAELWRAWENEICTLPAARDDASGTSREAGN